MLHGLLLLLVLLATYFSINAQYRSLRDQGLEQSRALLQQQTGLAGDLIEARLRLILSETVTHPLKTATADSELIHLLSEKLSHQNNAIIEPALALNDDTPDGLVVLLDEQGAILSSSESALIGKKIDSSTLPQSQRDVVDRYRSTNVNSAELFSNPVDGMVLIGGQSIQPIEGVRWELIVLRFNILDEVVGRINPLLWQLGSWAVPVVIAVVLVLVSTTFSLVRQRRRINELRAELINRDLQKARRIQLNWLPAPRTSNSKFDLAAENIPALHISGDFYNFFELPATSEDPVSRTAVILGDVSGHGLPAAFLMSTTQMLVRSTLCRVRDPGACLTEVNRQLCTLVYGGQFVTILILLIDHEANTMDIASAGQTTPLIKQSDIYKPLELDPDIVLGVDETASFSTHRMRLEPNATILMYTDGATETANTLSQQFGLQRMLQSLNKYAAYDPDSLIKNLLKDIASFRGEEDQEDDLTLLAIQLHPIQTMISPQPSVSN